MSEIREPKQKRSIETKEIIAKAGFELFCEKGYHGTNTIEISKYAGVSTGAVYSYFKDKRDIYIAAFDQYIGSFSNLLFEKLKSLQQPLDLSVFVDEWIAFYIDLFGTSEQALARLRIMMLEDEDINRHFCNFENAYALKITEILIHNGVISDNLLEKVFACCTLVDALSREKSVYPHEQLNFDVLKCQIKKAILNLLST